MRPFKRKERGSALLVTMIISAVLAASIAGLLYYVGAERQRAVGTGRLVTRQSCVESGLQLARSYFGRNFTQWNTYLANPSQYNPIPITHWVGGVPGPAAADPLTLDSTTNKPVLSATRPELFADLDGDNLPDVYIYIRDNDDEFPPAQPNPSRDNDQNVIVGAMCISSTMVPHSSVVNPLTAEAMLSYNPSKVYQNQGFFGASGTGNLN